MSRGFRHPTVAKLQLQALGEPTKLTVGSLSDALSSKACGPGCPPGSTPADWVVRVVQAGLKCHHPVPKAYHSVPGGPVMDPKPRATIFHGIVDCICPQAKHMTVEEVQCRGPTLGPQPEWSRVQGVCGLGLPRRPADDEWRK